MKIRQQLHVVHSPPSSLHDHAIVPARAIRPQCAYRQSPKCGPFAALKARIRPSRGLPFQPEPRPAGKSRRWRNGAWGSPRNPTCFAAPQDAEPWSALDQAAARYSLASAPMPAITTSTVLPGFIGSAPSEVPQRITSPGTSVMSCEISDTSCAGLKIMSEKA